MCYSLAMKRLIVLLIFSFFLIADARPFDGNSEVIMTSKHFDAYGQSCTDCKIVFNVVFYNTSGNTRCFDFEVTFKKGGKPYASSKYMEKVGPYKILKIEKIVKVDYVGCKENYGCGADRMDIKIDNVVLCSE